MESEIDYLSRKEKKNKEEDLCEPAFIVYFMNISLD